MMARVRRALCIMLGLSSAAHLEPAFAQTVRGSVFDSVTRVPLPGTLIRLLGADSVARGGTFTDDSGHFAIIAPEPGTYLIRVDRIGFRSVLSSPVPLGQGEVREVAVPASAVPIALDTLTVVAQQRCQARRSEATDGDAEEVARRWIEARKALDAADLAQQQKLLRLTVDDFQRDVSRAGNLVSERHRHRTGISTTPFVSAPAESLSARGYVRHGADSIDYFAPDAAVLLSEIFAGEHCWRAQSPDDSDRTMVGLAFEPVASRHLADVRGVLWLDARTAELKFMQFRYTSLPVSGHEERLGGRVDFKRLENGAWIVSHWVIRMPLMGPTDATAPGLPTMAGLLTLVGIRESGGEVLEARTLDGKLVGAASSGSHAPPRM